jgi:hypothetical protein
MKSRVAMVRQCNRFLHVGDQDVMFEHVKDGGRHNH